MIRENGTLSKALSDSVRPSNPHLSDYRVAARPHAWALPAAAPIRTQARRESEAQTSDHSNDIATQPQQRRRRRRIGLAAAADDATTDDWLLPWPS